MIRSAICKSCFSNGIVASSTIITTSAKRIARRPSATESFSSFSCTRDLRRRPAVSNSLMLRPRHSQSTEIESRVIPASGPVRRRSSPSMVLIIVDLPAFGRPTMAMRSGLVVSYSGMISSSGSSISSPISSPTALGVKASSAASSAR